MRTHLFSDDIHKAMAEKGYGGKEITVVTDFGTLFVEKGDKFFIKKIEWCEDCDEFHLILKERPTDE